MEQRKLPPAPPASSPPSRSGASLQSQSQSQSQPQPQPQPQPHTKTLSAVPQKKQLLVRKVLPKKQQQLQSDQPQQTQQVQHQHSPAAVKRQVLSPLPPSQPVKSQKRQFPSPSPPLTIKHRPPFPQPITGKQAQPQRGITRPQPPPPPQLPQRQTQAQPSAAQPQPEKKKQKEPAVPEIPDAKIFEAVNTETLQQLLERVPKSSEVKSHRKQTNKKKFRMHLNSLCFLFLQLLSFIKTHTHTASYAHTEFLGRAHRVH